MEGQVGMMKRKYSKLESIENDHPITKENEGEFLYNLQNGLLLALREQGILNLMQYRHAVEKLRRQWGKSEPEKGRGQ